MSNQPNHTTPAPKPDAQPVQAAYTAEDYHDARLHGSYGNAAEIAEALASASDLSPSVRDAWLAVSAKMRAKAQPVQAASSTPGPWEIWGNVGEMDLAVGPVAGGAAVAQIVTVNGIGIMSEESAQLGAANARLIAAAPALLAALETIVEAGRISDQPRAVYCALIAEDALTAAGNREDLKARGTKREALLAALEQCLPYVDRIRAMSGGDGDLTALTARAAIASAKGQ